jgi:lipoprotein NlpI
LCVAKTEGLEAARKTVIPSRGDRREPMMSILEMLQDKIEPAEVERRAKEIPIQDPVNGSLARFYGDLYIALYHDALGQSQSARQYLKRSLSYGVEGYMSQTAKVYLQHRFKNSESSESKANP